MRGKTQVMGMVESTSNGRERRAAFVRAFALMLALALPLTPARAAEPARNPVPAEVTLIHEPPTNPAHQAIHARVLGDPTFEGARRFFASFRLKQPLVIRTRSCSGRGGAWYYEGAVTVCYEYLQNAVDNARSDRRPDWVSEEDAIRGQFTDVLYHEGAHALIEFLGIPLFSREEDAADTMASFAVLALFRQDAPALINGIVYSYLVDTGVKNFNELPSLESRTIASRQYGGAHSTPLQRLFNVVCLAAGSDPASYRALVSRSDMPAWRANGCEEEYKQVAHAVRTLLAPHLDRDALERQFPGTVWPEVARR
jgi:hypothetical protein